MKRLAVLLGVARVPFLPLSLLCGLLPIALAEWQGVEYRWQDAILLLSAALAGHVAVNALNEYADFRSGLDAMTRRTPFSGGSGTLPAMPAGASLALGLGALCLLSTVVIGLHFVALRGGALFWPGLLGVALVVGYTPWINRMPLLCLLAPGLGFGMVITGGGYLALSGQFTLASLLLSLVMCGLVSGLLLLNQWPDQAADAAAGRSHWLLRYGPASALRVLLGLWLLSVAALLVGIAGQWLPSEAAVALLPVLFCPRIYQRVKQAGEDADALLPALGQNVALTLLTPALLAAALFFAKPL